ncbi:MAG: DUF4349 domain-containing protein [Bacteroidetes bacterium]|nr:DUF4349 domain-containing protein [Bacteroidota bacterium]
MKKRILKTATWLILGFAVLFCFRLAYSYSEKSTHDEEDGVFDFISDELVSRKNYASDRYKYIKSEMPAQAENTAVAGTMDVSQKYEKTALMRSKSTQFEEDEKTLRKRIRDFNAIIQYEQNTGNKGNRRLSLMIGVKPEKFDSFYVVLKKIGNSKQADITKVDKTSEYKKLNAQKISLEKVRESLIQLKNQNGKIDEFMNLENRILELEEQLQDLGVQIGDFDEENEFCTIKFSMSEGKAPIPMSFMHRAKVSFEWALTEYFWLMLVLTFVAGFSYLFLLIIDKLRILQGIAKGLQDKPKE